MRNRDVLLLNIKLFMHEAHQLQLRCRVKLAHFILSFGNNFPYALVCYDNYDDVETVTFGKNKAALINIKNKLLTNNKNVKTRRSTRAVA
jgi:hypothetical protein